MRTDPLRLPTGEHEERKVCGSERTRTKNAYPSLLRAKVAQSILLVR